MNALVAWQQGVQRLPDGRLIRKSPALIGRQFGLYDWSTDFPVSKQAKANDNSKTKITLEFLLDEKEIGEFRQEIKSNLNGTLPILISFDRQGYDLSVQKPGKGSVTLNKKSWRIADFVSRRIRFVYIPAIRTADSASRVIHQLVEKELQKLEDVPEYSSALEKIESLQKPIFDELATTIQTTVTGFLPGVKSVRLEAKRDARQRALRREVEILINDGYETKLERKGDGVQSLVALSLMRHAADQTQGNCSTVVAIEEPESHLHPSAIHELKAVIEELSAKNQVVLSSHSPLFVNMNDLSNTIIVSGSRAKAAHHVSEIREALGVRFSDNLHNASLVILVEGSDDAKALKAVIEHRSAKIKRAFDNGYLTIDFLNGASGLAQKATFYKASACNIQCFLDSDSEAKRAVEKAINNKALKLSEINMCSIPGLPESELEDVYDKNVYREAFIQSFGVDPKSDTTAKGKWSVTMAKRFQDAGKPWGDEVKAQVKGWLAEFASKSPGNIILEPVAGPLNNFISSVELKLADAPS